MRLAHLRAALPNLARAVVVFALIVGLALAAVGLAIGRHRLWTDFVPLDRSYVGPNLVASFVLWVAVVAHHESRAVQQAEQHHESALQAARLAARELLHPVEASEQAVADDVERDIVVAPAAEGP